jgi:hypothetical protein
MSLFRRFQTPIVALLLVLLASPAIAACCVGTPGAPPCCKETEGNRLAAPCCMSSAQGPRQQLPSSVAQLSKLEPFVPAGAIGQTPVASVDARPPAPVDQVAGPPGSHPLFLRLSVIRR